MIGDSGSKSRQKKQRVKPEAIHGKNVEMIEVEKSNEMKECKDEEVEEKEEIKTLEETVQEGAYDVQRKQQMYDFAQMIPGDDISGPPVTTLANHWGTGDDETAVQTQFERVLDILLRGYRDDPRSMEDSIGVDFIVPTHEAGEQVRNFIESTSFAGTPPSYSVHKGVLHGDRFMERSDFSIREGNDASDVERRWGEIHRLSNREDIEEDWNNSDVPEERRRQYRLSYNYLLHMCLFTDEEERNFADNNTGEEEKEAADDPRDTDSEYPSIFTDEESQDNVREEENEPADEPDTGSQDTERRYPKRDRKPSRM